MSLYTESHSSYPRVGEKPQELRLRSAYHQKDKKKISEVEFRKIEDSYVAEVVQEQESAGLDVVTDGLIRWRDPVSHVLQKCKGAEINGLLRFFDTNFYFRQPVIVGSLSKKESFLETEAQFLKSKAKKSAKIVLTGPVTLATLSKIETAVYDVKSLAEILADFIRDEIETLAQTGVEVIQVDEPALAENPDLLPVLKSLFRNLKLEDTRVNLALYFGDVAPVYEKLQDLDVNSLLLDFTYSSTLVSKIEKAGSTKKLGLGLFDGRNTRLERKEEIFPVLEKILKRASKQDHFLTTSCGVEYLPRDRALKKLKNMSSLAREWSTR